jgi:hypothetical protein
MDICSIKKTLAVTKYCGHLHPDKGQYRIQIDVNFIHTTATSLDHLVFTKTSWSVYNKGTVYACK